MVQRKRIRAELLVDGITVQEIRENDTRYRIEVQTKSGFDAQSAHLRKKYALQEEKAAPDGNHVNGVIHLPKGLV